MADLRTNYLGIELKNPIIASSSTLTDNVKSMEELERAGVSAVVLRSIFEEEITLEMESEIKAAIKEGYDESLFDYYDAKIKHDNISGYIKLINDAKNAVDIPVIASINCVSNHEWTYFTQKIEEAGADALELNMFLLPSDDKKTCEEQEKLYFDIIEKVLNTINIPVTLKISSYFSDLARMIERLSETGVKGLVLFNKFFAPDFDIENEKVISSYVLSNPQDIVTPLRWIAIMSDRVNVDLIASTGVHNGEGLIKQLLAGAKGVQIASTLYRNGMEIVENMLHDLEAWMNRKGYEKLDDFRGKLSYAKSVDPAIYTRMQFMKYFGDV
jgi:dihydroorotate dehydrogenase (fumarate)